uniref:Putative secreted protein n=1 Tax=Anopheles darlingi TaxID=43151 RepID=A0A2M4DCL1_ANODA
MLLLLLVLVLMADSNVVGFLRPPSPVLQGPIDLEPRPLGHLGRKREIASGIVLCAAPPCNESKPGA